MNHQIAKYWPLGTTSPRLQRKSSSGSAAPSPSLHYQASVSDSRQHCETYCTHTYRVSLSVTRRVGGNEGESRDEASGVPKTGYPGRADAAALVAMKVHDIPAHYAYPRRERSHHDQAQRPELRCETVVNRHQNSQSCDCKTKTEYNERKSNLA